jgi:hypothetical protein
VGKVKEMQARRKTNTKEVIGRTDLLALVDLIVPQFQFSWDTTKPNYAWWDKFRRGMLPGYEIASRLVSPISKIRSVWALGDGLEFRLRATMNFERITYTNDQLKEWAASIRSMLSTLLRDLDELGDQYCIVNLDGSISIPSPDTVYVRRDPLDYRRVTAISVFTKLNDVEVKDTYTATKRTIDIKNTTTEAIDTRYGKISEGGIRTLEFDNPLGVIPVTSFHGRRSANETNGRVVYADDILLLSRYDDLANKGMDAAALMGTPIPVWSGVTDVDEEKESLETETGTYDVEGNAETAINFDVNAGVITTGNFDFKSPGIGFTKDIRDILKLLFLLILEEHQIPETVWGGELGQARATSVEQMKTFYAMIEGFRTDLEGIYDPDKGRVEGLMGLANVWLRTKALTDKRLVVDALTAAWPALAQTDEKLMFEKVKYLGDTGRLSDVTVVEILDVVEDAKGELEKARAEAEEKADAFDAAMAADLEDDPLVKPDADADDDPEEEAA